MKKYIFKLRSIDYRGDRIGDDVHLEIAANNKRFTMDIALDSGGTVKPNMEIFVVESTQKTLNVRIGITEKDAVYDDKGVTSQQITLTPQEQEITFVVGVHEQHKKQTKKRAEFTVVLSVHDSTFEALQLEKRLKSDPEKIKEGFNSAYVLKDSAFENNNAMSELEIQAFLDANRTQKDTKHISVLKFKGKSAADLIKQAADFYKINPKIILAKLQAEDNLVRGPRSISPGIDRFDWAFGTGVLEDGRRLPQFQGFNAQVKGAAETYRKWYDKAKEDNYTHPSVDTKKLKALNAATYSVYRYTPRLAGARLLYDVYLGFFGTEDLGGPTLSNVIDLKKSATVLGLIAFVLWGLVMSNHKADAGIVIETISGYSYKSVVQGGYGCQVPLFLDSFSEINGG